MALTTEEALQQLLRLLPVRYQASSAVLAVYAAIFAKVLQVTELDVIPSTTVGGAEGQWLTLLAGGYGITRATGESDENVRERIRSVADALTVDAIEDAVDALMAELTAVESILVEHWHAQLVFDTEDLEWALICDHSYLFDQHHAFTVIVPDFGDFPEGVYPTLVAEIERLRAAGVRAFLLAAGPP